MIELVWDEERRGTGTTASGASLDVGDAAEWSPVDLLALAAAGCVMRTFLQVAAEEHVPVLGYLSTSVVGALRRGPVDSRRAVHRRADGDRQGSRARIDATGRRALARRAPPCGPADGEAGCSPGGVHRGRGGVGPCAHVQPARSHAPSSRYYATPDVRARIVEYGGGSATAAPTAAYFATLPERRDTFLTWDHPVRWPARELPRLFRSTHDLARSLWDVENLVVFLDLDYQNVDAPGEPFVHPADVFLRLEPTFRATRRLFARAGLPVRAVMTGRGYHFVGVVPLVNPVVDALAALVPTTPGWFAGHLSRRPPAVDARMTERHARAYAGLGLLLEYASQRVIRASAAVSPLPVVVNGTIVGSGLAGREAVSNRLLAPWRSSRCPAHARALRSLPVASRASRYLRAGRSPSACRLSLRCPGTRTRP